MLVEFIKDLSLLSETYDNTSFISGKVDYLNLKNISLYGSIVNYVTSNNKATIINNSSGTVQSENGSSVEYNNNIKIDGIDIYMAINNTNNQTGEGNVSSDLILFNEIDSLINGKNYGIIKSIDGETGVKEDKITNDEGEEKITKYQIGVNGNSYNRTGYDGADGTSGGNIYIVSSSNEMSKLQFSDHGLLITGNGGNGGAGGASFRVDDIMGNGDLDYENNNNMQQQFEPGNGGEKGYKGKIYGLSEEIKENIVAKTQITECSLSKDGIDGMTGATGRGSVGCIRINNVNHTFAWEEPKFIQMILPDGTIESPIYSDLHENKIDDITDDIDDLVKKIISLGNYAQKEPGARK